MRRLDKNLKNVESYHTEEGMDLFPSEAEARTKGLKLRRRRCLISTILSNCRIL